MSQVVGWLKLLHPNEWKFSFCHKELSEELGSIIMIGDFPTESLVQLETNSSLLT